MAHAQVAAARRERERVSAEVKQHAQRVAARLHLDAGVEAPASTTRRAATAPARRRAPPRRRCCAMHQPLTPAGIGVPMISQWATAPGLLPFRKGPCVSLLASRKHQARTHGECGLHPPETSTSHAETTCGDKGQPARFGRWRMAFTSEAIAKRPDLLQHWRGPCMGGVDEPPKVLPNAVAAFRLLFPTAELGVQPEQRVPRDWTKSGLHRARAAGQVGSGHAVHH